MGARRATTASTKREPTATRSAARRTTKSSNTKAARSDDAPKNKGGRPPIVLTPEHLRQIETMAGLGLTEAAIASVLDMHPETLRHKKHIAEVSRALSRGKAKAEMIVGQALFTRAKGGEIKAITWWEMTRAGRSARTHVQTEELPSLRVVRE